MNKSKSWDGKTPDWELEPTGAEQKEAQGVGIEAAPSVAEMRMSELAAEAQEIAPENPEQKAADIEALREGIASITTQETVAIKPEQSPEVIELKPDEALEVSEQDKAWKELRREYPAVGEGARYGDIERTIKIAHRKHEDFYGHHAKATFFGAITAIPAAMLVANAPAVLSALAMGGGATSLTAMGVGVAATFGVLPMVAPFALLGYGLYNKFKRIRKKK